MKAVKVGASVILALAYSLAGAQESRQPAKFWTPDQIVWQSANAGIRAYDAGQTCGRAGHEMQSPFKSCTGASVWILAGIPASIGLSYVAHKTGHDKVARWVPRLFFATNAESVAYSEYNWHGYRKLKR